MLTGLGILRAGGVAYYDFHGFKSCSDLAVPQPAWFWGQSANAR